MARSWFLSEKKEGEGALAYLRKALTMAMGCFLGCFGINDYDFDSPPESVASRKKNDLTSLFHFDGESLGNEEETLHLLPEDLDFRELEDEAKFLKACGTLPDIPIEIRKATKKWEEKWEEDISALSGEEKFVKFDLWPQNASTEKLTLEKLCDDSPTPVKVSEELVTGAGSLEDTPCSCMTDGQNSKRGFISFTQSSDTQNVSTPVGVCDSESRSASSSASPTVFAPSVQFKNKYVRFDCELDDSAFSSKDYSSAGASQHSKQSGLTGSSSESRPSPYPTPLKLTSDMQTPGTVFPSYMRNTVAAKTARIRSQYVLCVTEPLEYLQQKELMGGSFDPILLNESLNLNDDANLSSTSLSDMEMKHLPEGRGMNSEASLSSWLKPPITQDGDNEQFGSISADNVHYGSTPANIHTLELKSDGVNMSHISPTMWDANGIPNSTHKYKEDQKVSWHATPFVERLEKALSGETFNYHRKPITEGQPVEFNVSEESDTTPAPLQF